jgi:hypothetical protein
MNSWTLLQKNSFSELTELLEQYAKVQNYGCKDATGFQRSFECNNFCHKYYMPEKKN